jgi:hypothetical protein
MTKASRPKRFRLRVRKTEWGPGRWYYVGDSEHLHECKRVAGYWKSHGFTTQVSPSQKRCRFQDLLESPIDGDPIACRIEGCKWVGDGLPVHLRKRHGMTVETYRQLHGYKGPAVVGTAKLAVVQAQRAQGRSGLIRAGMFVCQVHGTRTASLYFVESCNQDTVKMVVVCSSWQKRGAVYRMSLAEVLQRLKPVGVWSKRAYQSTSSGPSSSGPDSSGSPGCDSSS